MRVCRHGQNHEIAARSGNEESDGREEEGESKAFEHGRKGPAVGWTELLGQGVQVPIAGNWRFARTILLTRE